MRLIRSPLPWLVGVVAALFITGCGGDLATYRGYARGFASYPYLVKYPKAFEPITIPQVSRDSVVLISFNSPLTMPGSGAGPRAPGTVIVRCLRWREGETTQTFMERFYDELAPRYLDLEMEKIETEASGQAEYIVRDEKAYFVMRVIPLREERIAYVVETRSPPEDRDHYAEVFARARDSFRLLPKKTQGS